MIKLLYITNFGDRAIVDGGINREEALKRFLLDCGSSQIVVQDKWFKMNKFMRMLRLRRLKREIQQCCPDIIVLNYPSYPFFWQHKITRYYKQAMEFSRWLREWANLNDSLVVVDVMDLPFYQYEDLGLSMEMNAADFISLDNAIFHNADYIWVCSNKLCDLVRDKYGISEEVSRVVVNGANVYPILEDRPADIKSCFRFVYCGSLAKQRSTEELINTFISANIEKAELHLAGSDGEWIINTIKSSCVIYHGSLTEAEAAKLAHTCDVGLIYYPQEGYYHKAYATKLPFYVCCGLPVLCTNVQETGAAVRSLGVGIVADISLFGSAMEEIASNPDFKNQFAEAISSAASRLTWKHVYSVAWSSIVGE